MSLVCADCQKPLAAGSLMRVNGPVSFHACTCGGVWIADAQLNQLLGRATGRTPRADATPRHCPSCRGALESIELPRGIACETCRACKGVWLDPPDLPQLAVRGLAAAAQAATTKRSKPSPLPQRELQPAPEAEESLATGVAYALTSVVLDMLFEAVAEAAGVDTRHDRHRR